jgi:hypothetical protein
MSILSVKHLLGHPVFLFHILPFREIWSSKFKKILNCGDRDDDVEVT